MHRAVTFGDPTAARAVHANSMDLVEIGHRAIPLGDIANLCDRCDIAIHRIDRLEADELRPPRIGARQDAHTDRRAVPADGPSNLPLDAARNGRRITARPEMRVRRVPT